MTIQHQLERVIIVPVNGYINRLQAWASTAILAADLGVKHEVCWVPEAVAPSPAEQLFDSSTVAEQFIGLAEASASTGVDITSPPRYLRYHESAGVISLAGHDRGEQAFMPEVVRLLQNQSAARTLVIIAGGKFHLPGVADFNSERETFYSRIGWSPDIRRGVNSLSGAHPKYVALHVRETDRAATAPTRTQLSAALSKLLDEFPDHSLFIAADTAHAVERWSAWASQRGVDVWSQSGTEFDRSALAGGTAAMVDWLLLSGAQAGVGSRESSFVAEAAVASGNPESWKLVSASSSRQRIRSMAQHVHNGMRMPLRRVQTRHSRRT